MEGWQNIFAMQLLFRRISYHIGIYWNIGNFTSHLKHSPDCMSLRDSDNTIPMDSSDSLTVSLTFDFIPHTKYNKTPPAVVPASFYCPWSFDFLFSFLLLFFQHLDDDRDSCSEEMLFSSTDLLLETSEIVSLIFTLTFSAVIVKLANFGCSFFISKIEQWIASRRSMLWVWARWDLCHNNKQVCFRCVSLLPREIESINQPH